MGELLAQWNPPVHDDLMSELDVILIHIRAEQAAEYERLFAEQELPRWRDYKARGAFLSARISRVAFGTDNRQNVAKSVIAVRCQVMPRTASMTPIPGSRSSTGWPTCCSQKTRWCTAERYSTPSDHDTCGLGPPARWRHGS
jgi:hypothetical protein